MCTASSPGAIERRGNREMIEAAARRVNGGDLPEGFEVNHPDEKMMEKFFGDSPNLGGRELAA